MIVAAISILALSCIAAGIRVAMGGFVGVLAFWSACAAVFDTASVAQTTELFDQGRPASFRAIQSFFDGPIYGYESHFGGGPKEVGLTLVLPDNRSSQSEPLLVYGENGAQDFVYLYYTSPELLQVGFESTGLGGTLSKPFRVDYHKAHEILVFIGSWVPPDDHPLVRSLSQSARDAARVRVRISLDGNVVLDHAEQPHPKRAQVFVGESPFDRAFGARFTGNLQKVEMRPLQLPRD